MLGALSMNTRINVEAICHYHKEMKQTVTLIVKLNKIGVSKHERKYKEIYLKVVKGQSLTLISFLPLLFLN